MSINNHYDVVFVGWGASACILMIEMDKQSLLSKKNILIIFLKIQTFIWIKNLMIRLWSIIILLYKLLFTRGHKCIYLNFYFF